MNLYSKVLGKGKPLIIMHGVFGMGDNWQTLGRKWSETYEVHLMDMRNHGKSAHSNDFSYELMVEDIIEYMNDLGMENALMLGHSMGGKVGMLLSVLYPERVNKLIVADIAPKTYPPHHQEILKALNALQPQKLSGRGEAEKKISEFIQEEGTKQFLLKSLYWKEKGVLDWRFNLPVIAREIEKVSEGLSPNAIFFGPTLFLRGGKSWYILDEDEDLILDHFPEAIIETVENAGHWLHAEQPMDFYNKATAFLAD